MAIGPLEQAHGSAKHPRRARVHPRPAGTSDDVVAALGKLSEALETVEHARGLLYGFHRMCGSADLALQVAIDQLGSAGHAALADDIARVLVGRDVIDGKWSFQLVEAYDRDYWSVFREVEQHARTAVAGVEGDDPMPPHVFESDMKHREQQT